LNQSDPTDHALAAIASILDQPESQRRPERPAVETTPVAPEHPATPDGYCRIGPGPIAAIRLKWTVRRDDNGEYYVDETIGENSGPIVTGPMSGDEAVDLVNERESEARRRFEAIRNEMSGRLGAVNSVRKDNFEL
jgi:hypothetical protein